MKTLLFVIVIAVIAAAGYIYLQPRSTPPPVATEEPTVAETIPGPKVEPVDERPVGAILRSRARWPLRVTLTREREIVMPDGRMVLPVGREITATMITDEGMLQTMIMDQKLAVPFDQTDFMAVIAAIPAVQSASNEIARPRPMAPARRPRPTIDVGSRLAELKSRFPAKQVRTVGFLKDKRYYLTNSRETITQVQGGTRVSTTRRVPGVTTTGQPDTISIEVPHADVYSYYKGMVKTATVEGLPRTLRMIEDRIQTDLGRYTGQTGTYHHTVNAVQAQATVSWIQGTLRPYLRQLQAVGTN